MARHHRFGALALLMAMFLLPASGAFGKESTAAAVLAWNAIAQRASITVAKQYQAQSMIYIAFVQAAVYDAVVAVEGGYRPYASKLRRAPDASVDAAVASAAHAVLVNYFPSQRAALDADYAKALSVITDGIAKSDGIAVGRAAGEAIVELRRGDGLEADIGFTLPAAGPGVWQLAPGVTPQTPWVSKLKPFMLKGPDEFRPAPPQNLAGREWATGFNEVRDMGGNTSSARTPEQTDVARFWSTNAVEQYNAAFADVVRARGLGAVQAARLFAMGNLVGADSLIACFDAKYHYVFWRPQFSIPLGEGDGNPATTGDASWTPLLATPNHPEYPAAHGCLSAAEAEVFAAFLGGNRIDIDLKATVPNLVRATRHYDRADDLVQEVINARVWGGLHYRWSGVKGAELGGAVARATLQRHFMEEN